MQCVHFNTMYSLSGSLLRSSSSPVRHFQHIRKRIGTEKNREPVRTNWFAVVRGINELCDYGSKDGS